MPGTGGEEDAEPVDVVHRVEQGLDLPLVAAVGAEVDVPDVHRPAQRPDPAGELRADLRDLTVAAVAGPDDQLVPGEGGDVGTGSPGEARRDGPRRSGHRRCRRHGPR
ncbi:MAG: hypothetical protein QM747_20375 [Nocardioides sp.]